MSRNNKNARLHAEARERSKNRQNGSVGASKTEPKHGKRWTYRTNPEIAKRIAEMAKLTAGEKPNKTSGKKILEGAGAAASTADSRE